MSDVKPTYDELVAQLAAIRAAKPVGVISFGRSDKNPKFFTFKHGNKEAWPVSTTVEAWRTILANVKMIEAKLPKPL
jgi:hypothetical protein